MAEIKSALRSEYDLKSVIKTLEKLTSDVSVEVAYNLVGELLKSPIVDPKYKDAIKIMQYNFAIGSLRYALGENPAKVQPESLSIILGYLNPINTIIES